MEIRTRFLTKCSLAATTSMRILTVFLALVALVLAELTRVSDKNFKEVVIDSGKFTLVDFYADWCRHCKKLMPTIEQVDELFANVDDVQVVKINGDTDGRKMVTKYQVDGYPMLKMFHGDDEPIEFDGIRDLESISNFVQLVSGSRLSSAETKESKALKLHGDNFNAAVLENTGVKSLVVFTSLWCRFCKKLKPVWDRLANEIYANDPSVQFVEVQVDGENGELGMRLSDDYLVEDLPTVIFFDPSRRNATGGVYSEWYTGGNSLEPIVLYVNHVARLHRNKYGRLVDSAGTIKKLEDLLRSQLVAGSQSALAILDEINDLADAIEDEARLKEAFVRGVLLDNDDLQAIGYYRRLANQLVWGEKNVLQLELQRLTKVLDGDLRPATRDVLQKRANALKGVVGK